MAELEADIARTREDLADTVDQLTAKLDVKTRIRNRAAEAKDAATVQVRAARQQLVDVDGKAQAGDPGCRWRCDCGHRRGGPGQAVAAPHPASRPAAVRLMAGKRARSDDDRRSDEASRTRLPTSRTLPGT